MLLLMILTVNTITAWGLTAPVEITTDANGNGTIEDSEKKLYLIQTNAFQSFYIAPQADNTITTNNILGDYMLWYFLDAGKDNEGTENEIQYYYIVNNSTGKYICHAGGTEGNKRGVTLVDKTSSNDERCKFYIEENNTNSTTGFNNIDAKGKPSYFGLNKRNGSHVVDVNNDIHYHDVKLVQPSALPEEYLPEADYYYEAFEAIPAEDAEELMTYELTIPYKERTHFEEILHKIGFPVSAIKKVVSQAAVF